MTVQDDDRPSLQVPGLSRAPEREPVGSSWFVIHPQCRTPSVAASTKETTPQPINLNWMTLVVGLVAWKVYEPRTP